MCIFIANINNYMELKNSYTKEEINQIEHYAVRLHEFICTSEFHKKYSKFIKEKFYEELRYAHYFAQITRKIFLDPCDEIWVAVQVDKLRAEEDGCVKAYKIPSKELLFSIFNIQKKVHFQMAILNRGRGSFNAIDGYGFILLDNYLEKENPLITDTKEVIDFIAVMYERET